MYKSETFTGGSEGQGPLLQNSICLHSSYQPARNLIYIKHNRKKEKKVSFYQIKHNENNENNSDLDLNFVQYMLSINCTYNSIHVNGNIRYNCNCLPTYGEEDF